MILIWIVVLAVASFYVGAVMARGSWTPWKTRPKGKHVYETVKAEDEKCEEA